MMLLLLASTRKVPERAVKHLREGGREGGREEGRGR